MPNGKSRDPWNPDSKITRKDFLDGVAITAAGLAAASAMPGLTGAEAAFAASSAADPDFYPPTATGLKGQPDGVLSQFMAIDGKPNQEDVHSTRGGTGSSPASSRPPQRAGITTLRPVASLVITIVPVRTPTCIDAEKASTNQSVERTAAVPTAVSTSNFAGPATGSTMARNNPCPSDRTASCRWPAASTA